MKFTNSFSRDLGVFTWATLQAAYPNGGAALAALPTGTRAMVVESTWQGWFTPDIAKAYWTVVAPTSIVLDTTSQTGDTTGNDQVVKSALVAAGLLRACRKFRVLVALGKNGTTDAATSETLRVGTAGTTGDTSTFAYTAMSAANRSLPIAIEFVVSSSTQLRLHGPQNNLGWNGTGSGVVNPTLTTISNLDSNALYFSLCIDIAGTTNAPQVHSLEIELLT